MATNKRAFVISPEEYREIRKSTGLTQIALAKTLGLSRETMSEYENGHRAAPKNVITMLKIIAAKRQATLEGKKQDIFAYIDAPFDVSL